jgi:glucuronate isomerase
MTQRQITNHRSNNLLILFGGKRVLSEIILKFRHLKYRRSDVTIISSAQGFGTSKTILLELRCCFDTPSNGMTSTRKLAK